jgi:hypothetical protein
MVCKGQGTRNVGAGTICEKIDVMRVYFNGGWDLTVTLTEWERLKDCLMGEEVLEKCIT